MYAALENENYRSGIVLLGLLSAGCGCVRVEVFSTTITFSIQISTTLPVTFPKCSMILFTPWMRSRNAHMETIPGNQDGYNLTNVPSMWGYRPSVAYHTYVILLHHPSGAPGFFLDTNFKVLHR